MEHTDGPGPGHVTILSRTRVSCSWCISAGDSSSTSHWSLDQREGSCQVTLQVSGACRRGRSSETRMRPAPFVEPEVERGPWERRARRWLGSVEPCQTDPGRRNSPQCLGIPHWITAFSAEFCERLTSAPGEERALLASVTLSAALPDVESLGRPQCPSPPTTGEPTTGRTDPDFVSDVSEKEQRRGAKAVPGSGHQEHIKFVRLPSLPSQVSTSCGRLCFKNTRPSGRKSWKWEPKPRTATEGSLAWSRTGWTRWRER
ncbi:uncharacterized protein [Odocoileus virginianus]|uniref:Uncharacterized protein isoform X7 n=1 Tax=Odocoileus virginianus TaxID=9874 RepID=A0ABM4HJL9_ODOVR